MKSILFYIILFVSTYNYAQDSLNYYTKNIESNFKKKDLNGSDLFFHKKINYLKNQNNLEEYFYAHFDYYLLNPKPERIFILENADKNKWRKPKTNDENIAKLHVLINIAYHLNEFGNIPKATISYENAWLFHKTKNINNYDIIEYCLTPLANNYMRLGDYSRAEEILKNNFDLLEKNQNKTQLIKTFKNLATVYNLTNRSKKANQLLLSLFNITKLNKEQQSDIYTKMASNYYEQNDVNNAMGFINKSASLFPNTKTILINRNLKGSIFYNNKQYEIALNQFETALLFSKIISKREKAKLHVLIAKTLLKLNKLDKATTHFNDALSILIPKFKLVKTENKLEQMLYAENTLIDIFEGKAEIFKIKNNNIVAISNLELANKVADLLRTTFTSQQSKIDQQTKNRKRTEEIVQLYYGLFKSTNDKKYFEKIFLSIEKSKAIVLNDELIHKNSKYTKDSLLIHKNKLEKQKAFVTTKIIIEELKDKNADINFIKNQLVIKTGLTSKLQVLNEEIKTKYPFLNTDNQQITIAEIQQDLLVKNQLLVSFFETKNNWFIFSLNKTEDLKLRVLPKNEKLKNEISNYINLFFYNNGSSIKKDVTTYQKTAHYLYENLLQPELETTYKYLTIIPDKKLNFVSFDALLTKETTSSNFVNFPYLVKDVTINLTFSANILYLLKQEQLQKTESNYLGYFPFFKNKERNLQYLPNTLEEQISFKKHTNATCFMEQKATKKHFLNHYKNYNQIHLATHASAGGFLNPAVIEFYDETLYLPEIYGLNMQTDLLVLSACETGVGKMQKGEGIMSLARGFTYAGVKNLVVSLWKVNDKATSELMRSFYKHLKNNSKTDAIHKAKLDYLNNKNISSLKKSPYYWSSFVFVGNVELVTTPNNYWNYMIISGFLLLILLIFIQRFRKTK